MAAIACSSGSDSSLDDSDRTESDDSQETTDESTDSTDEQSAEQGTDATGATCPTVDRPTYDNFGKSFLDTYCTRCHSSSVVGAARNGATPNYNFDTLASVIERVGHIESVSASGPKATYTSMPPVADGPSVELREQLGQWLACLMDGVETAD